MMASLRSRVVWPAPPTPRPRAVGSSLSELHSAVMQALGLKPEQRVRSIDLHFAFGELPTATVEFAVLDAGEMVSVFESYDLRPLKREP